MSRGGAPALVLLALTAGPAWGQRAEWSVEFAAVRPVAVGKQPAGQEQGDAGTARVRALAILDARRAMIEAEFARVAGGAVPEGLPKALRDRMAAVIRAATQDGIPMEPVWARTAGESLILGPEGGAALEGCMDVATKLRFFDRELERARAVAAAEVQLATVLLASELRLREPQVVALREAVVRWNVDRRPTRSQVLAGDLVDEVLQERAFKKLLLPVQVAVLDRMRTAERPPVPADDGPGDDLTLGRGRYPEDDYTLEAAALCQFHGWSWADCRALELGAAMLGREARREGLRPARFGDAALFKTLTEPAESELWRALVARREALSGAAAPDPGPLHADDPAALIGARVDLLLAHLDRRLRLAPDQHEPLRAALTEFVEREYTARTRAFSALDEETLWRELRFEEDKDPRRGSSSRKRLCTALDGILTEPQRVDLGLVQ